MTQENLRAAVIAAASLAGSNDIFLLKDWKAITGGQRLQFIFDRAEEIAAWLDAKEAGRPVSARDVLRLGNEERKSAKLQPIIWDSRETMIAYSRWLDEHGYRDSVERQHEYAAAVD